MGILSRPICQILGGTGQPRNQGLNDYGLRLGFSF
jgi:hypothetical protein